MALKAAQILAGDTGAAAPAAGGAVAAATGPTPPLAVDAVWHTHLLYSRSYARMCAALLGVSAEGATSGAVVQCVIIPHEPTPGGAAASALFTAQYAAAQTLYAEAFGAPPSPRVWTPASHRFAPLEQFVMVTRRERGVLAAAAAAEERLRASMALGAAQLARRLDAAVAAAAAGAAAGGVPGAEDSEDERSGYSGYDYSDGGCG